MSARPPSPPAARKRGRKKRSLPPGAHGLPNPALPLQNRRVMIQHYRAKYGVK
jgi:hypothetical protein